MLFDKECLLSDAQAITVTADSTNVYDARADNAEVGLGEPIVVHFVVTEAFTADGAGTLTVTISTSNDNSSYTAIGNSSGAIGKATLALGYTFSISVPAGGDQYYKAIYTVATGPMTAGKITAQIGPRQESNTGVIFPRSTYKVV
jgi:hypothetical protein